MSGLLKTSWQIRLLQQYLDGLRVSMFRRFVTLQFENRRLPNKLRLRPGKSRERVGVDN